MTQAGTPLRFAAPSALRVCYVGQRLVLRVSVEAPAEFLDHGLAQVYQQRLDVPLGLEVPWWNGWPGLVAGAEMPLAAGAARSRLVFGGAVRELAREESVDLSGARVARLWLERTYEVDRTGELVLPALVAHYAIPTSQPSGGLLVPVPLEPRGVEQAGEPHVFDARALPESGRPPAFRGAIGVFEVRRELSADSIDIGAEFHMRILVSGVGNHGRFTLADPELPEGVHVLGRLEHADDERSALDLTLISGRVGLLELPPYAFASFDPGPDSAYRSARAPALALRVLARERDPEAAPGVHPLIGFDATGSVVVLLIGAAAVAALVLGALGWGIARLVRRLRG
jgi:hypothetical protein